MIFKTAKKLGIPKAVCKERNGNFAGKPKSPLC